MFNEKFYFIKWFNIFCIMVGIILLPSFAYAISVEISGHFGLKLKSDLNLKELGDPGIWKNQRGRPWIVGGDILFKPPFRLSKLGIGFRYQYSFLPEQDYIGDAIASTQAGQSIEQPSTSPINNKFKINTHRLALIANYRAINTKIFFAGILVALDLWRSLTIKATLDRSDSGSNEEIEISHKQLIRASGQIAIETGLRLPPSLFIKGEFGYDLSSFSGDFRCKDNTDSGICDNDLTKTRDNKLDLNSFYTVVGIGWSF